MTVSGIAVPFDELVSAAPTSPRRRTSTSSRDGRQVAAGAWVHCANSWLHDVQPSARLGVPCVWIDGDRTGQDDARAAGHLRGMVELLATLSSLAPAQT